MVRDPLTAGQLRGLWPRRSACIPLCRFPGVCAGYFSLSSSNTPFQSATPAPLLGWRAFQSTTLSTFCGALKFPGSRVTIDLWRMWRFETGKRAVKGVSEVGRSGISEISEGVSSVLSGPHPGESEVIAVRRQRFPRVLEPGIGDVVCASRHWALTAPHGSGSFLEVAAKRVSRRSVSLYFSGPIVQQHNS